MSVSPEVRRRLCVAFREAILARGGRDDVTFSHRRDDFIEMLPKIAEKHRLGKQSGGHSREQERIRGKLRILREAEDILGDPEVLQSGPALANLTASELSVVYRESLGQLPGPLTSVIKSLEWRLRQLESAPVAPGKGKKTFVPEWHAAVLQLYAKVVGGQPTAADAKPFRVILDLARDCAGLAPIRKADFEKLLAS